VGSAEEKRCPDIFRLPRDDMNSALASERVRSASA